MIINKEGFLVNAKDLVLEGSNVERLLDTKIEEFSDADLLMTTPGDIFTLDVEVYFNFFFVAFKHLKTGKFVTFEMSPDKPSLDINKLNWMMWRFCLVTFNGIKFDIPIITYSLTGASCEQLKIACDAIIQNQLTPWTFEKQFAVKIQSYNQIDLIEVAPLQGSLKLYAGRLHCERMQDLPYEPSAVLNREEGQIVKIYCCNDLENTELLFKELSSDIDLRIEMSKDYGIDLKSKSDAQIAEAVLNSELKKVLGYYPKRVKFNSSLVLTYNKPDFIKFKTSLLDDILKTVLNSKFELDGNGSPVMPAELAKLTVKINKTIYKLGMGGLHSQESKAAHIINDDEYLRDNDVASYYPNIILNQGLYPEHLGEAFLTVYKTIVETRLHAKEQSGICKKNGDKQGAKKWGKIANSLKIVINGSFGKLGNKYSTLYAPQLMLQTTITGQLALLMLIEKLEMNGIECISGNTDGVISKYLKTNHSKVRLLISEWEKETDFNTEETAGKAIYSRDVNTYVFVKAEGGDPEARFLDEKLGCKTKGAYSERGSALNSILSKNPETLICTDAVLEYIVNKTPVAETIKNCKDIRRFISVKNVKGGGQKDGVYLGKTVRFYYPKKEDGCISYVKSGNKVPKSDGARALMDLPKVLPDDIDYEKYIKTATDMLYDCGALKSKQVSFFD